VVLERHAQLFERPEICGEGDRMDGHMAGDVVAPVPVCSDGESGRRRRPEVTTAGNSRGRYRATDVDIETTMDVGGGYDLGWVVASEWLKYTVSVATPATYTLELRVASPGTGGTGHVEIDGVNVTGSVAVPNTGGWQTWMSVFVPGIPISAGPHVFRLVIDTNGNTGYFGNINFMRWTSP
jgi:hypothetical protein